MMMLHDSPVWRRMALLVIGALLCLPAAVRAEEWTAGFRLLEGIDGEEVGVWYPAHALEHTMRLGPYDISVAEGVSPAEGVFPLVLLSHGVGGHFRGHHITAELLARHGFVVAAAQHNDWLAAPFGWDNIMIERVWRVGALPYLLQEDAELAEVVDFDSVHLLGYSLGGATQLLVAGAEFNFGLFLDHCEKNGERDVEACDHAPWWHRAVAWVVGLFVKTVELPVLSLPIQKIALVAPLGQGSAPESLAAIENEVLIFRPEEDRVLREPFHATRLQKVLPNARLHSLPGHHYAFIAPPSPRVPLKEWWEEVRDPEGFSREDFITEVNAEILAFFIGEAGGDESPPE